MLSTSPRPYSELGQIVHPVMLLLLFKAVEYPGRYIKGLVLCPAHPFQTLHIFLILLDLLPEALTVWLWLWLCRRAGQHPVQRNKVTGMFLRKQWFFNSVIEVWWIYSSGQLMFPVCPAGREEGQLLPSNHIFCLSLIVSLHHFS